MIISIRKKIFVALFVLCTAIHTPQNSLAGSISLESANTLLMAYLNHLIGKLPRDMRRWAKPQLYKAKFDENRGVYWTTRLAEKGIAIEYLHESKTLDCLSPIHSFHDDENYLTLYKREGNVVWPWVFRALQEYANNGVSTNGAEIIFDPVSFRIYLRKRFEKPVSKRKFIKACNQVMKVGDHWNRKHIRPALDEYYARHTPPASATAKSKGFRATLVLAEDEVAFRNIWDRPSKVGKMNTPQPAIWTLSQVVVEDPIYGFVLFSGCATDPTGHCVITGSFEVIGPDGFSPTVKENVPLWNKSSPPDKHLQAAQKNLEYIFHQQEAIPGAYSIRGKVCDQIAQRCVELSLPLELLEKRKE